jgi:hypothetical protein
VHLVILGAAADPGVANPDRIAVRGDRIHGQIVSEAIPEHQRDTLIVGRVAGQPDLHEREAILIVPYMTDTGTLRQSPSTPGTSAGLPWCRTALSWV